MRDLVKYCIDNYYFDIYGNLFFKKIGHRRNLKSPVGHLNKYGYLVTTIKGKFMSVHRIIWILENKILPNGIIDHINGNRSDNRPINLRLGDYKLNARNTYKTRAGRLFGCHFCKYTKKWRAQIKINGKKFHLGRFNTEMEAHKRFIQEHKNLERLTK